MKISYATVRKKIFVSSKSFFFIKGIKGYQRSKFNISKAENLSEIIAKNFFSNISTKNRLILNFEAADAFDHFEIWLS